MNIDPPKSADRFLEFFCKGYLLEEVQGDLYEHFLKNCDQKGKTRAGLIYWYQVVNFVRPFAIKKSQNSNISIMFKYNFLIAFRNLKKHKFYSFINITGLAIAIACCLFIGIFIKHELSYDKHFENAENIFRISSHLRFNENEFQMATSPAPMKDGLKAEIPEIVESGRVRNVDDMLIQKGDYFVKQGNVAYADPSLLNIFKLDFIYGGQKGSLDNPQSVVLSRSAAEKFFGYEDPVGKSIKESDGTSYRVDGVYQDLPENTHFHFDVILSMNGLEHSKSTVWLANNYKNYFLLREDASYQAVNDKLPAAIRKFIEPQLMAMANIDYDQFYEKGDFLEYRLIPVTDIHLYSNLGNEIEANGSIQYVYIFAAVGVFILLLACINFMNLATAKSASRAKEVGMRKVMGSKKRFLIAQFLTESVVISFFAFGVAVAVMYVGLPFFNDFTGKNVINPLFGDMQLWPFVLSASLVVGLLAGIYPAFFLSAFRPLKVLKGEVSTGMKSGHLRNVLVVVQFAISIVMIMSTAVVYKQLRYSQNKRLGYDKDQIIILNNTYTLGDGLEAFRTELLGQTGIENATASYFLPTREGRSDYPFLREELSGAEHAVSMQVWRVDHRYIPTLSLNLVEGRNFDENLASDSSAIVINQTAAKRFGYLDPVGKKLKLIDAKDQADRFTIVGVIEDFYFDSFKRSIQPVMLQLRPGNFAMAVRYRSDDPMALVAQIESIWQKHAIGHPFEYSFMDQEFEAKFREEQRLGMIFTTFSSLAILIACLGLFALASYTAEQRRKEIGIRKVLGASVANIVRLLFSSFSKLLLVATVLAVPVGYYLMNGWLDDFAYRTEIGVGLIMFSCLLVFLIAWATIGLQSLKAAKSNPMDNLHYE